MVRKVAQDIECIAFPAKGFQDGFQIEDGGEKKYLLSYGCSFCGCRAKAGAALTGTV